MRTFPGAVAAAVVAIVLLSLSCSGARAGSVWLDELNLRNVQQDYGSAKAKKSVDGKDLSIGGRTFARGVGTHVDGEINIDLKGEAERFTASVGADDEVKGKLGEPIEFEVSGDGKS